jgi:steroid 5-alpha reductase family enzyme
MFAFMALAYALGADPARPRSLPLVVLATVWSLRLSIYISWRNWGHDEDRRNVAICARNDPHFSLKSLYLVFGLQALLAWIISLPLLGGILSVAPRGVLDSLGALLWIAGFSFEAGGDWQLARFKSDPANHGRVMDRGFWRFTRHPNYIGDFCVWWGVYLIAVSAGALWSIAGPLLMSVLLTRVSGVTLFKKKGNRRASSPTRRLRSPDERFFSGDAEAMKITSREPMPKEAMAAG